MILRVLNAASGPEGAWTHQAGVVAPSFGNILAQTANTVLVNVPNLEAGDVLYTTMLGSGFIPAVANGLIPTAAVFAVGVAQVSMFNITAGAINTAGSVWIGELLVVRPRNTRNA